MFTVPWIFSYTFSISSGIKKMSTEQAFPLFKKRDCHEK